MFWKTELKEAYDVDGCFDGFEYEEATGPFAVWTCDYWKEFGCNAAWVSQVEPGTWVYPENFNGVLLLGFAENLAAAENAAQAHRLEVGDNAPNARVGQWFEIVN